MLSPLISASIMCADFAHLADDVRRLQTAGVEMLHCDIMDGHFVPNLTFGPDVCAHLRAMSPLPLDIHLMVEHPLLFIAAFRPQPGDIVLVHAECADDLGESLERIADTGATPGLCLKPATPVEAVRAYLGQIGAVLLMTVEPGFAGQVLLENTLVKITQTRALLDGAGFTRSRVGVDGNVSFENARRMRALGADLFVAGSSGLFVAGMSREEAAGLLRQAISGLA